MKSLRVLFLCVHNSARSQMAEALLRAMSPERFQVFSAGSEPTNVHPFSRRVLQERGHDATGLRAKSVSEFANEEFDYVITLCAEEVCPVHLGARARLHWAMRDPSAHVDPDERLAAFRRAADELERHIMGWLPTIKFL